MVQANGVLNTLPLYINYELLLIVIKPEDIRFSKNSNYTIYHITFMLLQLCKDLAASYVRLEKHNDYGFE